MPLKETCLEECMQLEGDAIQIRMHVIPFVQVHIYMFRTVKLSMIPGVVSMPIMCTTTDQQLASY